MERNIKLRIIVLLLGILFCALIYGEDSGYNDSSTHNKANNLDKVEIFIDISGSMYYVFNEIQRYVTGTILENIEIGQHLAIYKFYKKIVPIYDQVVEKQSDIEYAKQRVNALLANGPWTNLNAVFDMISRNGQLSSFNTFYVFTDGLHEPDETTNYQLNEDNVLDYLNIAYLTEYDGWYLIESELSVVGAIQPVNKETVIAPIEIVAESSQEEAVFIKLNIIILWLLFLLVLITFVFSKNSFKLYKVVEKKVVAIEQLKQIGKKSTVLIHMSLVLLVFAFILKISFMFISQIQIMLIVSIVANIATFIFSLYVIIITLRKKIEIDKICANILVEAEKYDLKLEKDITESDIEKENDAHKQLVLGIIFIKDQEFNKKTGLQGKDIWFLFLAVALQCARQYLFTTLNLRETRLGDKDAAKATKIDEEKLAQKHLGDDYEKRKTRSSVDYNPSLEEIITRPVPFDVTFGSKETNLNIGGGFEHRAKTLGHDPILGWIFGTANIATSTLTTNDLRSMHIRTGYKSNGIAQDKISDQANTTFVISNMFDKLLSQGLEGKAKVAASLAKEYIHLKSDIHSKMSLPLPVLSTVSPEMAKKIANYGVDMENIITVGKQATFAIGINMLIVLIHRLTYDENKDSDLKLFKVRTNKIISYSNAIASTTNALWVGANVAFGDKKQVKNLDIGGLIVTLSTLINNKAMQRRIKIEYILNHTKD